ncbi:hypothetical protein Q5W_04865 [Hydrogenophaga sp. PBC]|uniref:hypothetical protein n=1 Tax=Hydrogenophaga sp. PBC TaxID=795665 RepID=UPI0002608BD4|nr:hypothetical protein [Hydrogenophaga sp. PBC]AOS78347.1 hypothetical protein Q5W_04865 [Hydrogenophaga sp. PBC]
MTERVVAEQVSELGSAPVPGSGLAALQGEVLSRASFGAGVATLSPETASSPLPPGLAARLLAESLAGSWPPIEAPALWIEVLRRDTASSALVATGMEVFGDAPWPDAPRGVFALRHDWAEPLVERLEWQTAVTRLASGNESRQARRRVPRRLLTYQVGHARQADALVADWLADHLGHMALWPLPQYAAHVVEASDRGAMALAVAAADERRFGPPAADLRLRFDGLQGWESDERWILIIALDGWQTARLAHVEAARLWLADPLARAVPAGAAVMPLAWGMASEAADLAQWVPGMAGGRVTASLAPAPLPDMALLDDPVLDGLPVWPDGNWRDDPSVTAQAVLTRQDLSPADPWVRRDDPWPTTTLQRRYLATGPQDIERWRARLWRTQGRLGSFWLPDGLAPVLSVISEADPEDGFLRVTGEDISAFWHRPAACLILHPDGTRQHVLTATAHRDAGGVLVLRSGLDAPAPAGSRVVRLARCRLDHDAVDLYWHSPTLLEITLTARQLPEPRGNDRETYGEYAV